MSNSLTLGLAVVALALAVAGIVWSTRPDRTPDGPASAGPSPQSESAPSGFDTPLPARRIPALRRRAEAGDNDAAESLGNHYEVLHRREDQERWHGLAAGRGHCRSMSALRERAYRERDRSGAARWNAMMRAHACTWGKMHPLASDNENASIPMWTGE